MENPDLIPSSEIAELYERFRKDVKHAINNDLAVIMAQAELGQRNPAYYEKLAVSVLERGPKIVTLLQSFQQALQATFDATAANRPTPPASAVFKKFQA